jgi:hypothetical protein
MSTAVLFMEKYQEKTRKLQVEYVEKGKLPKPFNVCGLTSSAGVVLAHAHYPVSDLMTLAGDLMKSAKREAAAQRKGEEMGTLDFMALSEAGSEPIKDRRAREYTMNHKKIMLTERPYTTVECRRLLAVIRAMKGSNVPRSKLKALYAVLFQGPLQAQFDALRIKERLKATGDLEQGSVLHSLVTDLPLFPFRKLDDGTWSTPLTEIIELYDFIRPGGHETSPGAETEEHAEAAHE